MKRISVWLILLFLFCIFPFFALCDEGAPPASSYWTLDSNGNVTTVGGKAIIVGGVGVDLYDATNDETIPLAAMNGKTIVNYGATGTEEYHL